MRQELDTVAAIIRPAEDTFSDHAEVIRAEHQAIRETGTAQVEHARNAGERLAQVWDRLKEQNRLIRWLKVSAELNHRTAANYLKIYQDWDKCETVSHLGVRGVLEYLRTGKTGEEEDDEPEAPVRKYLTLAEWDALDVSQRRAAWSASRKADPDAAFNSQGGNENIEWALWSWNPVTGCQHNCPYCYARDIANRFYESKFEPTVWPGRMGAAKNTRFPEEKITEELVRETPDGNAQAMGLGNVFVCSMADLFGRWVPREWIDAVLKEVKAAPRWNFLFLTKFPQRMAEFAFPDNAWVGTTVDCQARVKNAEKAFRKIRAKVKWLSCEPLIEPLRFEDIGAFDWVVVGGAKGSTQTPDWHPPRDWSESLRAAARAAGVRFYEKSNLLQRVREYPGLDPVVPTEAPESLRYLPEAG